MVDDKKKKKKKRNSDNNEVDKNTGSIALILPLNLFHAKTLRPLYALLQYNEKSSRESRNFKLLTEVKLHDPVLMRELGILPVDSSISLKPYISFLKEDDETMFRREVSFSSK